MDINIFDRKQANVGLFCDCFPPVMDNGSDLVADYPDSYFADARTALGIAPEEFVMLFVGTVTDREAAI